MEEPADFEDIDFDQYVEDGDAGESQRKRKKRVRNWTAEDRARHRVFERSRREAFNERLNELAGLLPNLQTTKEAQLSKHVIVDESVKHHLSQRATIEELSQSLSDVKAQHEQLLAEVAAMRSAMSSSTLCVGDPTNRAAAPIVRAGIPTYAANTTKPRGAVLPDLGTYPDSLVQLAPDPPGIDATTALEGMEHQVSGTRMPEIVPSLQHSGSSLACPSSAISQDERLQRLFESFQDPTAAAHDAQASHMYAPTSDWPDISEIDHAGAPASMHDPWRMQWHMQWHLNNSQEWGQTSTASARAELDLNDAMNFRNDTSIMNF